MPPVFEGTLFLLPAEARTDNESDNEEEKDHGHGHLLA
uniref:Uncharacterized protein n=1 Tax=Setaria italica TaxID=4555 RepID=K3ZG24_SETIT